MKKSTVEQIRKRVEKRVSKRSFSADGKRHDRVRFHEEKEMQALFSQYVGTEGETGAVRKIAKDLKRDPSTIEKHLVGMGLIAKAEELSGTSMKVGTEIEQTIARLRAFKVTLGGCSIDAADVLREARIQLALGISEYEMRDLVNKQLVTRGADLSGQEVGEANDALVAQLSLLKAIRTDQRRTSSGPRQWDLDYFRLTDLGKDVILKLQDSAGDR